MAKNSFLLLAVVLASALAGAQTSSQLSSASEPDLKIPFLGSALTCSQSHIFRIPKPVAGRAQLKVRLLTLLRESLFDDEKGIVNFAREKEIKKLANKLKDE